MHDDEVEVDDALVGRLLANQLPELADRPLRRLDTWGTDHVIFRLGDDLSVRMPKIWWAAKQGDWDVAERELLSVRPAQDAALLADIRDAYGQLGRHWSKEGQPAKARGAYEQLWRDQPTQAARDYAAQYLNEPK